MTNSQANIVELQRLTTLLAAQGYEIVKATIEGEEINLIIKKARPETETEKTE